MKPASEASGVDRLDGVARRRHAAQPLRHDPSSSFSPSSFVEKTSNRSLMDLESSPPPSPLSPIQSSRSIGPRWLVLAIGSGAFAAFNGVFAKLTTTSSTHGLAASISHLFGLPTTPTLIELTVRILFFLLNLASNAVMWILFTRALTAASSTTRVAILNTSSNFLLTAVLGMVLFGEGLPVLWWLGASLLIGGSVVIGAREGNIEDNGGNDIAAGRSRRRSRRDRRRDDAVNPAVLEAQPYTDDPGGGIEPKPPPEGKERHEEKEKPNDEESSDMYSATGEASG